MNDMQKEKIEKKATAGLWTPLETQSGIQVVAE
jgi:hypothetical protein